MFSMLTHPLSQALVWMANISFFRWLPVTLLIVSFAVKNLFKSFLFLFLFFLLSWYLLLFCIFGYFVMNWFFCIYFWIPWDEMILLYPTHLLYWLTIPLSSWLYFFLLVHLKIIIYIFWSSWFTFKLHWHIHIFFLGVLDS